MTKEELEKYARENRKRLDAQDVKLGDVVKLLVGQFAGETGIIVGISACHNDYTDPYYEVDMNCEVPEKYKCRKTLITPNNVVGGLSVHEFEVIGNRASKQSSMEIKQGDKVRVSKEAPKIYLIGWYGFTCNVIDIEDNHAKIECNDCVLVIPTKYLVKVDAEVKEAKCKLEDWTNEVCNAIKEYGDAMCKITADAYNEAYWEAYTADLAREIAVKSMEKSYGCDPERIADYAVSVAKAVVEGLKRKWYERTRASEDRQRRIDEPPKPRLGVRWA